MNLTQADIEREYQVKDIETEDEELKSFLFFFRLLQRRAYYRDFEKKEKLCGFCQRRQI